MLIYWFQSSSWLSKLIRLVTRSPYSHVGIQIGGCFYEATGKGIKGFHAEDNYGGRLEDAVAYHMIKLTTADRSEVMDFLNHQVGHRYSVSGFISAGLASLTGYRLVVAVGGEYICSGLVATALQIAGESFEEPRTETPASLALKYQPLSLPHAKPVSLSAVQSAAQHRITLGKG